MQRGRHQYAGRAFLCKAAQIGGVAHTARGVDADVRRGATAKFGDPVEIRPEPGADAIQRHRDHAARPEGGRGGKLGRSEKMPAALIEREHEAGRAKCGKKLACDLRVRHCLTAEDRDDAGRACRRRCCGLFRVPVAGVEPDRQVRKPGGERRDAIHMPAAPFDRIEIGDIDAPERRQREQSAQHRRRRAAAVGERRADRAIRSAVAALRVHDLAAAQVEDGNNGEGRRHGTSGMRLFVWEYVTGGGCLGSPLPASLAAELEPIAAAVARTLPGLWGHVGIDLIDSPDRGPVVVDINPRLTTSYAGLRGSIGANPAALLLSLANQPLAALRRPLAVEPVEITVAQA